MADLTTKIAGLTMKNPVMTASGTFGYGVEFADFVKATGSKYWQVLPIGPTSYGDSPYQSFSAFAGNPYFIDLDVLVEEGLLLQEEIDAKKWFIVVVQELFRFYWLILPLRLLAQQLLQNILL